MVLYRGTCTGRSWVGDQLTFTAVFSIVCPAHFTREDCLTTATNWFEFNFDARLLDTFGDRIVAWRFSVEALHEGNEEPVNRCSLSEGRILSTVTIHMGRLGLF